ncbi:hypothetical protein DFS34DRAFT_564578, partial [Phlyctochytrium arcticum]
QRSRGRDRGINTPIDGYNEQEKIDLSFHFFDQDSATMENRLRNRVCYLLQQAVIGRSRLILNLEWGDIWSQALDPKAEGPTPGYVIGITSRKTNVHGRVDISGIMRHADEELCAQNS